MEEEKWVFWPAQSKWLVLWFALGLCLTRHIKNHLPFNQLAFPLTLQIHYPGAYVQVGRQFPVRGFPMCSQSIFNSNAWLNSFSEAGSSCCENSHVSNSCFDWFRFICCNFSCFFIRHHLLLSVQLFIVLPLVLVEFFQATLIW